MAIKSNLVAGVTNGANIFKLNYRHAELALLDIYSFSRVAETLPVRTASSGSLTVLDLTGLAVSCAPTQ